MVDSGRSIYKDYVGTQKKINYDPNTSIPENIWTRTWSHSLYDNDKEYLLLLGDAVTEGMSFYYEELVGGNWHVHRQTGSITITSKFYLNRIRKGLTAARKEYNMICYTPCVMGEETPEEYNKALRSAVAEIKKLQPNARLLLVGNTMGAADAIGKDTNIRIYGYNKAMELLADEIGAEFVDLGTFSERIKADLAENGVVFTDAGYKKLTFEVVKKIK